MSMPDNRHFAAGREFSFIEALFQATENKVGATGPAPAAGGHFSRTGKGLGDDGYLLQVGGETWAVSVDSSVEGIHYRLDWATPEASLEKAVLSNLSDINAMGGRAKLVFLALGALTGWDAEQIRRLGDTLRGLEARHGFKIVGGDTVIKQSESFFTITVMGPVTGKPLLRSGAKPGHRIYVSGRLGGSAAGLALLSQGYRPDTIDPKMAPFLRAHLQPTPPLELGPFLSGLPGSGAAIDISDGLSSELWHIARQSGCRPTVEWGKLPYDAALRELPGNKPWDGDVLGRRGPEAGPEAWRDWVLNGGEEYQILFTGDFTEAELAAMRRIAAVTEIGGVAAGEGVGILDEAGSESELKAGGWSH